MERETASIRITKTGQRVLLGDAVTTVGRGQGNSIVLSDIEIARNHAVIWKENGAWYLQDLGSLNGTVVNGRKAVAGERIPLGEHSIILLAGASELVFEVTKEAQEEKPAEKKEKGKKPGKKLLLAALLIAAVGFGGVSLYQASQARAYSDTIAAYLQTAGTYGERVAVFDADKERYVKAYLTEDGLLAATPEEIGAILVLLPGEGNTIDAKLRYLPGKEIVAETNISRGGDSEPIEEWCGKELQAYREHLEIQGFFAGNPETAGDKIAYLDPVSNRYAYSSDYLPEELQGKSPEELGGYFSYHTSEESLSATYGYSFTETQGTGEVLELTLYKALNVPFERTELHAKAPSSISMGADSFHATVSAEDVQAWLTSAAASLRFNTDFNAKLKQQKMGEGSQIIAQEIISGHYGTRYVPAELIASEPADVALIVLYVSDSERVESTYGALMNSFTVEGTEEVIHVQLLDGGDRRVITENTFHAGTPRVASEDDNGFHTDVSEETVKKWVSEEADNYFYDKRVRGILEAGKLGGEALVVYDADEDRYLTHYGVDALTENDTIRAVAEIRSDGERSISAIYSGIGNPFKTISGTAEAISITITDLTSGYRIASVVLVAEAPESLDSSAHSFAASVNEEDIEAWITENWNRYLGKQ